MLVLTCESPVLSDDVLKPALVQTSLSNEVGWTLPRLRSAKGGKRRVPQFRHRRVPIPELPCFELTLLDVLRQLVSANG